MSVDFFDFRQTLFEVPCAADRMARAQPTPPAYARKDADRIYGQRYFPAPLPTTGHTAAVAPESCGRATAASVLVRSGANLTTVRGPGGRGYAVGGEASIDVSPGRTPSAQVSNLKPLLNAPNGNGIRLSHARLQRPLQVLLHRQTDKPGPLIREVLKSSGFFAVSKYRLVPLRSRSQRNA